eukprot:scaffold101456_cov19-Tisochrysis_lutea.AAC.1
MSTQKAVEDLRQMINLNVRVLAARAVRGRPGAPENHPLRQGKKKPSGGPCFGQASHAWHAMLCKAAPKVAALLTYSSVLCNKILCPFC